MGWIAIVGFLFGGIGGSAVEVSVEAAADGVRVAEQWEFGESGPERFVRTVFLREWPGRWPLRQRMEDLEVLGPGGEAVEASVLSYGQDRVRIVVDRGPGQLLIRYRLLGVRADGKRRGQFAMELYDERPQRVRIVGVETAIDAHAYDQDYDKNQLVERADSDWRGGPLAPNSGLTIAIDGEAAAIPLADEVRVQLGVGLVAIAFMFVLTLLLLPAPGAWRAGGLFVGLGVSGVLMLWYLVPIVRFDASAPQYSGLERIVSAASASLVYLGIVLVLGLVVWRWAVSLRRADKDAWHAAFGLPVFFAMLLWPAAAVEPGLLLVPFPAALPLIAWATRGGRLWSGADLDRLVALVRAEGLIPLDDLARRSRLRPARLDTLLHAHPHLGIVTDWQTREALSPASAALRERAVCAGCGGAMRLSTGSGLAQCAYCTRSFAQIEPLEPQRPTPPVVRGLAQLFESASVGVGIWTALLAIVALADEWLQNGLMDALWYVAILTLVGLGFAAVVLSGADSIRKGNSYSVLRGLLLLLGPFILPLFAFRALGTRRAQIHFGRFDVGAIQTRLEQDDVITIEQLSQWLGCTREEATELAVFLIGNDQLDAIFDRRELRLVRRQIYATLAENVSCTTCGGLRSEVEGEVRCTWCGTKAA